METDLGPDMSSNEYENAQLAVSMLKASVYNLLMQHKATGLRNVEIAKKLGIRGGVGPHSDIRHYDWISKTILSIMEREEVVEQIGKHWHLK